VSALWRDRAMLPEGTAGERTLQAMTTVQLDAVMAIEVAAYSFPWSRGNFIDSLAAGHPAWLLKGRGDELLGYFVAMLGVDEVHLLNITVTPTAQGRGHARVLLDALLSVAREHGARKLWLEVRETNGAARAIYRRLGFVQVGVRKGYYPAALGRREDAVVMSLQIDPAASEAGDALG
jgi:ribosomal-protein-alanine N-acetyltransferase